MCSVLIACAAGVASACPAEFDRPNLLFIMSDDHTTQAFGSYGSRLDEADANNPHIEAIINALSVD
jgi:hypothetical protein